MENVLEGCWAKLSRASETLEVLTSEIEIFNLEAAKEIYMWGALADDGLEYVVRARGDVLIPPRFAVLTGEIVHHMRSSLDHLICALVVANGGKPTRQHQFPICSNRDLYNAAREKGSLRGLKQSTCKIIEDQQPFTQANPADTILAVVQEYDNQDKHRLLLVTSSVAAIHNQLVLGGEATTGEGGVENHLRIVSFKDFQQPATLSKEGVRVFSCQFEKPIADFNVQATPKFEVALKQCGAVTNAILPFTMKNILAGVRGTIRLFEGEL